MTCRNSYYIGKSGIESPFCWGISGQTLDTNEFNEDISVFEYKSSKCILIHQRVRKIKINKSQRPKMYWFRLYFEIRFLLKQWNESIRCYTCRGDKLGLTAGPVVSKIIMMAKMFCKHQIISPYW